MAIQRGLLLDKVVLLGRTFEEYRQFLGLGDDCRDLRLLDVAAGVSSFCAEASEAGWKVTAFDRIYGRPVTDIEAQCGPDLDAVVDGMRGVDTYRWDFYGSPEGMRRYRERAYRRFLQDYPARQGERYVRGELPVLPFADDAFDLSLVSYLLLVYEHQFSYEFHRQSIRELMRVSRREARIYPTVTFEAGRSRYLDRLKADQELRHLEFEEVPTDFEFLIGSNSYLAIRRRP